MVQVFHPRIPMQPLFHSSHVSPGDWVSAFRSPAISFSAIGGALDFGPAPGGGAAFRMSVPTA